jgi:hypothetical protein
VGFFGSYVFAGTGWTPVPDEDVLDFAEPWLSVDIHDSDITTVEYRPTGPGSGVVYLGETPRTYFEDATASEPTNVALEAAGLASWWAHWRGRGDAERTAKERELAAYLAEDTEPPELDDDDLSGNGASPDDGEAFVEVKTARFLTAMDLPLPDDLAR